MIRMLLTTTALAALLTSGAMAQDAAAPADPNAPAAQAPAAPAAQTPAQPSPMDAPAAPEAGMTEGAGERPPLVMSEGYAATEGDNLASRILGSTVYTTAGDDAETIGDINDLVVDANGEIAAAVIGVGGFLGVGEKNVAVDFAELQWTTAADGSQRYVLPTDADALTAAPAFEYDDETAAEQQQNVGAAAPAASPNEAPANNAMAPAAPAENAEGAGAAAFDRSALQDLDESTLTAEELTGTRVFGVNDEEIGVIGDFVLNEGGDIDAVVVDVGGFLGLGRKPVAVGFDNLNFSVDADNNRYLFINTTKEQLEAQPEFNADTYSAERDTQRLAVQP